jgi:soluble lytic murein transglycosylase
MKTTMDKSQYPQTAAEWLRVMLCCFVSVMPGIVSGMVPATHSGLDEPAVSPLLDPQQDSLDNQEFLGRVVNFNSAALADQRARFIEAEKALRLHRLSKFHKILSTLTDYPLYPYLRYEELRHRLKKTSPDELKQFLSDYESLPIAPLLRKKWLRLKARQGRWQQFLDFYTPQQNTRLQCDYLEALIHTGQAELAYPKIGQLWLSSHSQPRSCDRIFKRWQAAGKQSTELVWQRLELTLEAGHRTLARYLVRSLPAPEQPLAKLWIKLHQKPQLLAKYQHRLITSRHTMAPTIFRNIIKRMARETPQAAADLWFDTAAKTPIDAIDQYAMLQSLAIALARQQQPGSEAWLSIIPDRYLTDTAREWRVRSALRQSQWPLALTALNALTETQQASDRWQYWRARVNDELGKSAKALPYYTALAQRRSYYGFLAADRLGLPYVLNDQVQQTNAGTLFEISQQPGILRAHELLQLKRMTQARREWQKATSQLSNHERVDAAKLAQYWGWAQQSILTMAGTDQRDDIALRFPLLYQEKVLSHSEQANINPAWAYGVIRRESAFAPDARSSKGAVGLMQLLPSTAKSLSHSLPRKYQGKSRLTHADTNLALGTHYLRKMLERFSGQTVLATAAYNAGASRIMGWLPTESTLDAERWIETIPFKETRDYVTSVLAFTIIYADRLGIEQDRLSQSMPAVPSLKAL